MMGHKSKATVLDVFNHIQNSELAVLNSRLTDHMNDAVKSEVPEGEEGTTAIEIASMKHYFNCPANEPWGYKKYFESESPFATRQGIKRSEFDRVLTILDDAEGTHRQFSYDKYFGVADLSDTDNENIKQGKDSVIDRTRRLFYVSCSRAKKDLVVIYYVRDTDYTVTKVYEMGIFPKERVLTEKDFIA